MPLPVPSLDDRRFQDIVDQAKTLIPRYTPEWTDHNVSDPGVTLIELFAWMTEMLLYRVNQVPEKMYIKFLELIGVHLDPPRAARALVTLYLSAAQPTDVVIAAGTEIASIRTETAPAIVFTTEADLTIRSTGKRLKAALTRDASRASADSWRVHDLAQLGLPGQRIAIFPEQPAVGDALYLALDADCSQHVLALVLDCELAGGAGVDPRHPPIKWEAWQGGLTRWAPCDLEYDGTGGFNQPGEVILHTPTMALGEFEGTRSYWLRCVLTEVQAEAGAYVVSPALNSIRVEARGGTVQAFHGITITNEVLGTSDGTPGQRFSLLHAPLLSRDPKHEHLLVELPGGDLQVWQEVTDFAESGPNDRHYTLDSLDGSLTLGPSLLQPDGTVYQFGAIPPRESLLRFNRYRHGGGTFGNVPAGTLTVLKSSIPYVSQVTNRAPAMEGRDPQSLDDAKLRAPHTLRTRTRAVTADDFEYLTTQVPGVARARCLAPGSQPGAPGEPQPGQIVVIVLPQTDLRDGRVAPSQLVFPADLRAAVLSHLDERRLLGVALDVRPPQYLWISISARLRLPEGSDPALVIEVRQAAEAALYRYLNPFTGGPRGDGWGFGRDLYQSEIFSLLQGLPNVEFVEEVQVQVTEPGGGASSRPAPARLPVPPHGLICSDRHDVKVS